jgi:phenylpyruvate tautomerase PptA (4-oxalocrotonate tautomerase family)
MPLYTVMTQAGALGGEAKAKLAGELTTFHSEYAGVPKNWVHIVFQDYAPGASCHGSQDGRRIILVTPMMGNGMRIAQSRWPASARWINSSDLGRHQRRDIKACKVPLNARTKRSVIKLSWRNLLLTERDGRARLASAFRHVAFGFYTGWVIRDRVKPAAGLAMSASLIGRLGSSAFRQSTTTV